MLSRVSRLARFGFLLCLSACGAPPPPPVATPASARDARAEVPAEDVARFAFWENVRKNDGALPEGDRAPDLVPELERMLASSDPIRRDRHGYEVFWRWILDKPKLGPAELRPLAGRLLSKLAVTTHGESDAVFGRSFAALTLSLVLARNVKEPFLEGAELDRISAALRTYAHEENDLRGYVDGKGWAHAPAHTSDALKFLARSRDLSPLAANHILDAVRDFAIRRHGYAFHHGEDARLARPILELVKRGTLDARGLASWAGQVAAPTLEKWPEPFDPAWHAAAQNARALLSAIYAALSFADETDAKSREAFAALRPVLATAMGTPIAAAAPKPPAPEPAQGPTLSCAELAVELVLDRSGSMQGTPMDMTKDAAKRVLESLAATDCAGVIAFDSTPSLVLPLRAADDPASAKAAVDGIKAGGGTEILAALAMAKRELARAPRAKRRLVVFVTDGQAPASGVRELVKEMAAAKIVVTTIALGSSADESLLRMIASESGGRFRKIMNAKDLPKAMTAELTPPRGP